MMTMDYFLKSPLVNINFAGFKAHTLELQNNGWQFSASQRISPSHASREIQLMMTHDGGGLTMISRVELLDMDFMMRSISLSEMNVMAVSIDGRSHFFAANRMQSIDMDFRKREFSAIDCTPAYEKIDLSAIDLRKFGVFKKINDAANIFLPEKTVNELMEEILKKQDPKQKEIRQSNRRRQFMQEFNRNPNEEIKLQLVAI